MSDRGTPSVSEAIEYVTAYQNQLAQFKFQQETQRDKTLVLISGGALTVSFAFVSTLVQHTTIIRLPWLISAWSAWVGALILTVVAYTVSISIYNAVILRLSRGEWEEAQEVPWLNKFVEPLNKLISILAVAGFVLFGFFAIGNLELVANAHKEKASQQNVATQKESDGATSQKESDSKVQGSGQLGPLPSATTGGLPEAPKK